MASPAPHFFFGKGVHNLGSAVDSLMSLAVWISSHNFAGLSRRSITATNPSPSALSSVSKIHFRQMYELLQVSKTVKITKTGIICYTITNLVFIVIETARLCATLYQQLTKSFHKIVQKSLRRVKEVWNNADGATIFDLKKAF